MILRRIPINKIVYLLASAIVIFFFSCQQVKEIPDEIEETQIAPGTYNLAELLVNTNLASSKKEAKRLIEQGGVKIGGEKVSDTNAEIELKDEILIQVGKRKFLKIKVK